MNRKAFSLIELSIVILIIGIVIAGVTQGSRVVGQMKLSSARAQTQSSPVVSIQNLVAWWESTSEKSFLSSETSDTSTLTTWYDINPQSPTKFNITQSTTGNKPTYSDAGINGIPAVKFNGSSSYFQLSYDVALNPAALSVCAVTRTIATDDYGAIISSRNDYGSKLGYILYATPDPTYQAWFGSGTGSYGISLPNSAISVGKTDIICFTNDGTTEGFYVNGATIGIATEPYAQNDSPPLRIGAGANEQSPSFFLNAYIGEIIFFDRVLKTEERQSIEKYLGKKWGIKVS